MCDFIELASSRSLFISADSIYLSFFSIYFLCFSLSLSLSFLLYSLCLSFALVFTDFSVSSGNWHELRANYIVLIHSTLISIFIFFLSAPFNSFHSILSLFFYFAVQFGLDSLWINSNSFYFFDVYILDNNFFVRCYFSFNLSWYRVFFAAISKYQNGFYVCLMDDSNIPREYSKDWKSNFLIGSNDVYILLKSFIIKPLIVSNLYYSLNDGNFKV